MSEEDIIFSTYEAVSVVITTRLIDKGVKPLESFSPLDHSQDRSLLPCNSSTD